MLGEAGDAQHMQSIQETVLSNELKGSYRWNIQGVAQRLPQSQGTVVHVTVIMKGMLTAAHGFAHFRIVDQGGGSPASF